MEDDRVEDAVRTEQAEHVAFAQPGRGECAGEPVDHVGQLGVADDLASRPVDQRRMLTAGAGLAEHGSWSGTSGMSTSPYGLRKDMAGSRVQSAECRSGADAVASAPERGPGKTRSDR